LLSWVKSNPNARIVDGCATELRLHAGEPRDRRGWQHTLWLPWTIVFKLQPMILGGIQDALGKAGTLATFAYFGSNLMPSGQNTASGGKQD
jgi:hypothetical protein